MVRQIKGMVALSDEILWEKAVGKGKYKKHKSAYELSKAWTATASFPDSVKKAFTDSKVPALRGIRIIECIAEKATLLDTKAHPSMNDLMIYCNSKEGPLVITVEGKVCESFGPVVSKWKSDKSSAESSASRDRRLKYLASILELAKEIPNDLNYQLLHRTASAIIEARLAGASTAVVLVHAFGKSSESNKKAFKYFLGFLEGHRDGVGEYYGNKKFNSNPEVTVHFFWIHDDFTRA